MDTNPDKPSDIGDTEYERIEKKHGLNQQQIIEMEEIIIIAYSIGQYELRNKSYSFGQLLLGIENKNYAYELVALILSRLVSLLVNNTTLDAVVHIKAGLKWSEEDLDEKRESLMQWIEAISLDHLLNCLILVAQQRVNKRTVEK